MNSSVIETEPNQLIKEAPSPRECDEEFRNGCENTLPDVIDGPRKIRKKSHQPAESDPVNLETKNNEFAEIWAETKCADPTGREHFDWWKSIFPLPILKETLTERPFQQFSLPSPLRRPPETVKIVRMNLPSLVIPEEMFYPHEKAVMDLQELLRNKGFGVSDRATLSFFALGKELDVQAAAECFTHVYELLNSAEFKSPNRALMEQMQEDNFVEGFARHEDGTFGAHLKLRNWSVSEHVTAYLFRDLLCYIFNLVDYTLLRGGLTHIMNARDVSWRQFAPFEQARATMLWRKCCPMTVRHNFLVDLGTYGRIAHSVLSPLAPISNVTLVSTADALDKYPDIVLPHSLTGSHNDHIEYLTIDEKMAFRFFIE